jgi:short subunit dehydrogenase-like uncharacterized protein
MAGRLLIYGATGFTGRLIAQHARDSGIEIILAGRNPVRLQDLSQKLRVPYRVAMLHNLSQLDAALRDIAVMINAAGPFDETACPLVEACQRTGTHYLDVSGELPVFQLLHRYSEQAQARGVMIMPGTGFVVVASDCLAAHVAARMPQARHLRLALSRTDLVSRGSLATMLRLTRECVSIRRDGDLCAVGVGTLERTFDFGDGERIATAVSWADVFSAYYTTGIANIEVYVEADAWARWLYQFGAWLAEPLQLKPVQSLLSLPTRAWPRGPTERQRIGAPRVIVAEAEDRYRRCVTARLYTPDGYSFTLLSAVAIAQRVLAGEFRAGFQTPAQVFGADFPLAFEGVRREDVNQAAEFTQ